MHSPNRLSLWLSLLIIITTLINADSTSTSSPVEYFKGVDKRFARILIVTDRSFASKMAQGDPTATFNYIKQSFTKVNNVFAHSHFIRQDYENLLGHGSTVVYDFHGFEFAIDTIKLNDARFDRFQGNRPLSLDTIRKRIVKEDFIDQASYALVVVLTGLRILNETANEDINGFNESGMCEKGKNVIAVSFYGCRPGNDSTCLSTWLHEDGHAAGSNHDGEGGHAMRPRKELNYTPTDLTLSENSKEDIAIRILRIQGDPRQQGCFTEAPKEVRVISAHAAVRPAQIPEMAEDQPQQDIDVIAQAEAQTISPWMKWIIGVVFGAVVACIYAIYSCYRTTQSKRYADPPQGRASFSSLSEWISLSLETDNGSASHTAESSESSSLMEETSSSSAASSSSSSKTNIRGDRPMESRSMENNLQTDGGASHRSEPANRTIVVQLDKNGQQLIRYRLNINKTE